MQFEPGNRLVQCAVASNYPKPGSLKGRQHTCRQDRNPATSGDAVGVLRYFARILHSIALPFLEHGEASFSLVNAGKVPVAVWDVPAGKVKPAQQIDSAGNRYRCPKCFDRIMSRHDFQSASPNWKGIRSKNVTIPGQFSLSFRAKLAWKLFSASVITRAAGRSCHMIQTAVYEI